MEVQQAPRYKFPIRNYQKAIQNKRYMGRQKPLYLFLYDDYMMIQEQGQDGVKDSFYYKDMTFLSFFQSQSKSVFVIQEKKYDKQLTGSFRQNQAEACKIIYEFVNKKIEINNDANQSQTVTQKKNILEKLREKEKHIYGRIYEKYKDIFSSEWLDSVLFEDHETVKEYDTLARLRAHENQRKLILKKVKARRADNGLHHFSLNSEIPLQKYDFEKISEGTRFHDDYKKVNFVPKQQDKQEDLIVDALPNADPVRQVDSLAEIKLLDEPMEIEETGRNKVTQDVDKNYQSGIFLPPAQKDKFKLLQPKNIDLEGTSGTSKPQKKRQELREFNETIARKVKIWIKIFYRVQSHSQLRREHITAIQSQLNHLKNADPKVPIFLERAIQKTLKNILLWKRDENNMHRE